jgi:hypothetical protein
MSVAAGSTAYRPNNRQNMIRINRAFIGPLTPAQQRRRMRARVRFAGYRQFADAYDGVTFREFLTNPAIIRMRRETFQP